MRCQQSAALAVYAHFGMFMTTDSGSVVQINLVDDAVTIEQTPRNTAVYCY
ncbi:hypothetical protein [Endozoicomonas acroporae]|uniref:hypothetical protein n=1 Tax=Endozoicomonas acroporae TaxID=1701104 RepID=UPI003D7A7E89